MMNKKGFTLAEVLITLSILGVVAAILIPNVIGQYKKNYTETRLKQAYSILDNALDMAKSEYNMSFQEMCNNSFNKSTGQQMNEFFVKNYFLPYIKVTKYCERNSCSIFSFNSPGYNNGTYLDSRIILSLDGKRNNVASYSPLDWYTIQLANGMNIGVMVDYWSHRRIFFIVDINGKKAPNRVGYDIFYFAIYRNYLQSDQNKGDRVYAGAPSLESQENAQTCNGGGQGCAAVIKRNNWKIPKDYPVKF